MSTLSSANVTDVNLVQKERAHKIKMNILCINIPIRTHILGNWPIRCLDLVCDFFFIGRTGRQNEISPAEQEPSLF